MSSKPKSLGTINNPECEILDFDSRHMIVTLKISNLTKCVTVTFPIGYVRRMVDTAREIVGKQREHAMGQWEFYKGLKRYTGFNPPEGQE